MTFELKQRVSITSGPFVGMTGSVVRLLKRVSDEAWIELDADPPPDKAVFPKSDARHRHVLIFDDEVEELTAR